MTKPLMKSMLCLTAVLAFACAPSAFAGHGHYRGGYHGYGGGYHGHYGRYYGGYGRPYYHRDHFGNWIAGAIVLGAVTSLVVDATQPTVYYTSPPPAVYANPPVVYSSPPVVYSSPGVVYRNAPPVGSDPYQTRYIGHDDSYQGN